MRCRSFIAAVAGAAMSLSAGLGSLRQRSIYEYSVSPWLPPIAVVGGNRRLRRITSGRPASIGHAQLNADPYRASEKDGHTNSSHKSICRITSSLHTFSTVYVKYSTGKTAIEGHRAERQCRSRILQQTHEVAPYY